MNFSMFDSPMEQEKIPFDFSTITPSEFYWVYFETLTKYSDNTAIKFNDNEMRFLSQLSLQFTNLLLDLKLNPNDFYLESTLLSCGYITLKVFMDDEQQAWFGRIKLRGRKDYQVATLHPIKVEYIEINDD